MAPRWRPTLPHAVVRTGGRPKRACTRRHLAGGRPVCKSLLVRGLNALAAANLHGSGYAADRRHQVARREHERRPRHG